MVIQQQVSKFLSLLLRHKPEILGITIDSDGFASVSLSELVSFMSQQPNYQDLTVQDIITLVAEDQKGRYKIVGDRIRALYDHSVPVSLLKENTPSIDKTPEFLYHGTSKKSIDSIFLHGLISGNRVYVHLSDNLERAISVGKRHSSNPVIIKINAKGFVKDGNTVKKAGKDTYISESINPKYLSILE